MAGPGVDSQGQPAADPTRNVLDLVQAAVVRLDDLRIASEKLLDVQLQRLDDMRVAESARIDAIRAVDVGAVQRAAEVANTQAITLAAQVSTSAETLRTQAAATAAAHNVTLGAALEPIQKDIADLRRAQYEALGQKTQVVEAQAKGVDSRGIYTLILAGVVGISTLILAAAGIAVTLILK
jgi:hypothetical protein